MILGLSAADQTTELILLPDGALSAGQRLDEQRWESGRQLADQLLSRIEQLLKRHDCKWDDLSGIVLLAGPGSFTSLRIGHTVGNTLAASLDLPIANAQGEEWLEAALQALPKRTAGEPVWPFYGGEPNITSPR